MKTSPKFYLSLLVLSNALNLVLAQDAAISYQGRLTAAGNPANGNYDMQFKLFDSSAVGSGTQQGSTIVDATVPVTEFSR